MKTTVLFRMIVLVAMVFAGIAEHRVITLLLMRKE